jgi:hypothetical protein
MDFKAIPKGIRPSPICVKELFRKYGVDARCKCPRCNAIHLGRPPKPENKLPFPELMPKEE